MALDIKFEIPTADQLLKLTNIGNLGLDLNKVYPPPKLSKPNNPLAPSGTKLRKQQLGISFLSDKVSDKIFDDSEIGRATGTLFSSGVTAAGNTIVDNLIKGNIFSDGLALNVGASLAGAGAGIAANYMGKGITSLMGDSRLGRAVGSGFATGLGTIGGTVASNLAKYGTLLGKTAEGAKAASIFGKGAGAINPYALGAQVLGSALGAATGPSNEYNGEYGGITRTMDTAYDVATIGANFIPVGGQIISGAMALNKGLSNIFGSTDGMTVLDAILGSAFMPAPVKWLNMVGSSKTGGFQNLSWLNSEKTNSFMQNAFGDLGDKFDLARREAGKTYGTFSQGAKRRAQDNLNFANYAWNRVLSMADLNELQNIRSLAMSSINNLRYAQMIQGGYSPLAIGKQGMKIFDNATNHNIGMRLLSAAALIDNKAMILSAGNGTKIPKLQTAWLTILSDNTRVSNTHVELPFTPKQWKLELFRRSLEEVRRKLASFSSDNRSTWEKQEGERKAKEAQLKELRIKNKEAAIKAFLGLSAMVSPSYWVELTTGKELGTTGRLAVDLTTPFILGKGLQLTGKGLLLARQGTNKFARFGVSSYTGNWITFGSKQYRLKPGYLGMNGSPVESRPLLITAGNAASITPEQWTAAQDVAIARGDIAEAQRLRDLHFKVSAPDTQIKDVQYHGAKGNAKFNVFDPKLIGQTDQGWAGRGYYFTPTIDYAKMYGSEPRAFYINAQKVHDGTASTYFGRENSPAANIFKIIRKKHGNDGQQILDELAASDAIRTSFPQTQPYNGVFEEVVTRNNNQMKLADAVTYDNNGVRIPLGERDNFKLNDIRYGWLPWFLGGSTAATLYNTNK